MPSRFRCGECAAVYDVDDNLAGKTIRCRECAQPGKVPSLSCTCTACETRIDCVPETLAGSELRCPKCRAHVLVPIPKVRRRSEPQPTELKPRTVSEVAAPEEPAPRKKKAQPSLDVVIVTLVSVFFLAGLPFVWMSCEASRDRQFIKEERREFQRDLERQQRETQRDLEKALRGY